MSQIVSAFLGTGILEGLASGIHRMSQVAPAFLGTTIPECLASGTSWDVPTVLGTVWTGILEGLASECPK